MSETKDTQQLDTFTKLAMELQSIAQNGLAYVDNPFDQERFERVRTIAAQMMSMKTGLPVDKIKTLFCSESGYQTPKLDTRAAIFKDGQILLVQEQGAWTLPGGWVDYNESIASNTVKEVKEEAGLDVIPCKIIAIQERNKHNTPPYAYGICKVFVLCRLLGGTFQPNIETTTSGFFSLDALPKLDDRKTSCEQIQMCFDAQDAEYWETKFD